MATVQTTRDSDVLIVTINRPEVRNAIDARTAQALTDAFLSFDRDGAASVAILTGAGANFCAGADLKAIAGGEDRDISEKKTAPMGPTRLLLSKPVIAAVEGYAVAGGLELALWCDLRVAAADAVLGIFCRRFGIPLLDLGTVRLPRLIGHSRAMDMILTGRAVPADEALQIGLVNRLAPTGQALRDAVQLARDIAAFPQLCLRSDRLSAYEQWSLSYEDAWRNELRRGDQVRAAGEPYDGARAFAAGQGKHGVF